MVPAGVLLSRFVTATVRPDGPSLITNARSGAFAVATSSGAPPTGTVRATLARPMGTTDSVWSSRFAVMAYSPLRRGSESAPGGGDGEATAIGSRASGVRGDGTGAGAGSVSAGPR